MEAFKRAGLVAAIVAALVTVVALATACGGGGGGSDEAEEVMERFLRIGQEEGGMTDVLIGEKPADLPEGLPEYPGASLIGATVTTNAQQSGYTVLYESDDSLEEVLQYFEEALEESPWQVVLSTSSEGFGVLQFSRIDDPNFVGGVVAQESGEELNILVSAQLAGSEAVTEEPFELPESKPLPRGFPAQVPIPSDVTIIETGWARSTEANDFQITFLSKMTSEGVLDFYRSELGTLGWSVTEEPPQGGVTTISFENNALGATWSGTVSTATFTREPSYSQTRLQLHIGPSPEPTAAPTPAVTP